jgi:hypothetical protein
VILIYFSAESRLGLCGNGKRVDIIIDWCGVYLRVPCRRLCGERRVPTGYEKKIIDLKILTDGYPHLNMYWNANTSTK